MYEEYTKVQSPEELMDFMNKYITYGLVDNGEVYTGANPDKFEWACKNRWHLAIKDELARSGYGHCFDQVELERDWFQKHGYEIKSFFIWFQLDYPNNYTMHTYLVYKDGDLWKLFEHSDYLNRGIRAFNSLEEAVNFQKNNHIKMNREQQDISQEELASLKIYEYGEPTISYNFANFLDYILEKGKSWEEKIEL